MGIGARDGTCANKLRDHTNFWAGGSVTGPINRPDTKKTK